MARRVKQRFVHPETRFSEPEISNYPALADRKRLSGPGLRRFFRIMEKWKVSARDARLLLGGISSRYYNQLKERQQGRILNQDRLLRVNCIIAIHKALHSLLPASQANQWAQKVNWEWFHGATPLAYMIRWDILFVVDLRRRLEKLAQQKKSENPAKADSL